MTGSTASGDVVARLILRANAYEDEGAADFTPADAKLLLEAAATINQLRMLERERNEWKRLSDDLRYRISELERPW